MQLELHSLWRPAVAALILAWLVALGLTASHDFNNLRAEPQPPEHSIALSTTINTSKPASIEYSSIAEMLLMGIAEPAPMLKTTLAELPETRLELSLRGLFVSKGSELSGAVIETGDKQPSFYQVGDLISDDITLAAIEGHAAVIERNGKREKLSFDQAVITIDSYSRSKNPDFIQQPSEMKSDRLITETDQPGESPQNQSLEDRLRKLRRQYQQKN